MKKLERNKVAKKLISVLLILAMILPYFPLSVFAADNTNNENNGSSEKVSIRASWNNNEDPVEGTTNDTFGFNYSVTFNGAPNGFKDVQLIVETDGEYLDEVVVNGTTGGADPTSQDVARKSAIIEYANINQGVSVGGQISVKFKNTSTYAERKVTIKVKGTYVDPDSKETCKIEDVVSPIELNAKITPADEITTYDADITWQRVRSIFGGYYYTASPTLNRNTTEDLYGEVIYGTQDQIVGFYTRDIKATYPIEIYSAEKTQKLELKVTINRYDYDNNSEKVSKMSDGKTIDWGGLVEDFGNPTETTNSDGSVTYTFTKGADSDTYDASSAFAVNKKYTVNVIYNTLNTNPKTDNPLTNIRTNVSFNSELNTTGFKLTKVYNTENPQTEKITKQRVLSDERNIELYSYTPDKSAWIKVKDYSSSIGNSETVNSKINSGIREILKNDREATITLKAGIVFTDGSRVANQNGNINFNSPKLNYIDDNGQYKSITLTPNQMKLNKISKSNRNLINYFVNDGNEEAFDYTYNNTADVNNFSIKLEDFLVNGGYNQYDLEYKLDVDALGLSNNEINNIQGIAVNYSTSGSGSIQGSGTFLLLKENDTEINKYSYMELVLGNNFDARASDINKWEEKSITLKLCKNENIFIDSDTIKNYVVDENPVFFVNLPGSSTGKIEYDLEDLDIGCEHSNLIIDYENLDFITGNDGEDYIVIPCIGEYDSRVTRNAVNITISGLKRRLVDPSAQSYDLKAYMLTDNENYYREANNANEFMIGENTPDKIFLASAKFNVNGSNKLEATTGVKDEISKKSHKPNPSNSIDELAELTKPLPIKRNTKAIYTSEMKSENDELKNIEFLIRLPFANNTDINTGNKIIDDNTIGQVSLTNLEFVSVETEKNQNTINPIRTTVPSNKYKIYYTTEEAATYDSTSFVEYVAGTSDLSQAKNIKVVFNEDYILEKYSNIEFTYKMTMPSQEGTVGAETAVKYVKVEDGTSDILVSPAAYVKEGDTSTTIKVQKIFEGFEKGVAPTEYGVNSLAGIEFKLQYYDTESGTRKFVQENNHDVVATTDATGVATFTNIPYGRYFLYEVTQFDNYSGIGNLVVINTEPGETILIDAENNLKFGTIIINKTWEGLSNRTGTASFSAVRRNAENESLNVNRSASMNQVNETSIIKVPYGTYVVNETSCSDGWVPEETPKIVRLDSTTVNNGVVTVTFNNKVGKGTLKIEKTVPEGETVDGLKFKVVGRTMITDSPETLPFNPNVNMTITVGGNNPSNVTVEKQDNDTKAVITISDTYLGLYSITEVDIPKINGTEIEKYIPVSQYVRLTSNGATVRVPLENKYRTGTLKIVKTSEPGVELDQFKVNVKCDQTFYGTNYNKTFDVPANGILYVNDLLLGDYTVTEIESDYFNPKYGVEKTDTAVPVTVEFNKTIETQIYNENVTRKVKILKLIEGKDASKAIGIKFRIYGKDQAGKDVNEVIEITDTETIEGVKYGVGISNPIPTGGEYELVEIEETVPDYFVGIDPRPIDIKKSTNENDPYVIKIDNKRGKGNLEMTTKFEPDTDNKSPLRYRINEVELSIDENGKQTYTKVPGTETIKDGIAGFAEMTAIDAGWYLVELIDAPSGYNKDEQVPQLVEVPVGETGYAEFLLERIQVGENTKVVINKELLNAQGNVATATEIQAAKLNANESFEARITNVDTNEVYYSFFNNSEAGVVKGLPSGRYEIEEVFKPKYTTYSYLIKVDDNYVAIEKDATTGKYYFEIPQVINNVGVTVNLKIQNKLNTEYGFGGQDTKNNLSTVLMEQVNRITKTIMYITDENGDAIPGVAIKLYDQRGNEVEIPYDNNTYVTNSNKKVIIKALPVGTYTVKVVSVPDGYVKPADKVISVYEGATMVTRIEVWEDKPVGSLKLKTTYTDENGTIYAPRSKYKILEPNTGRVLTFEKTASGNYIRSKAPTATDTISLRAGEVTVTGIEVGNYQLGLVDLTEKYGVINTEPESLTIAENSAVEKEVKVQKRYAFKKVEGTYNYAYALSEDGELYYVTHTRLNMYLEGPEKVNNPSLANVKIKDFQMSQNADTAIVLLDENGKVWGYEGSDLLTDGNFICLSDKQDHPFNGLVIKSIDTFGNDYFGAVDANGKIWCWGNRAANIASYVEGVDPSTNSAISQDNPVCLSDNTILENVQIDKVVFGGDYNNGYVFAIDNSGELYVWGNSSKYKFGFEEANNDLIEKPVCATRLDGSSIKGKKIKDISTSNQKAYFIDEEGALWSCDESGCAKVSGVDGVKFEKISTQNGVNNATYAIDSNGKLWGWDAEAGTLGLTSTETITTPYCISDASSNNLDTVVVKDVSPSGNRFGVCVDENGDLWIWGHNEYATTMPLGYNAGNSNVPKRINVLQNAYFDLLDVKSMSLGSNSALILDKAGKLWTIGDNGIIRSGYISGNAHTYNSAQLRNYNSIQVGTLLENINVKDYAFARFNAVIIDTDGKLWTAGPVNNRYNYAKYGKDNNTNSEGYEWIQPLCITDIPGYETTGIKMKFATVASNGVDYFTIAVIDEQGNLYTAGQYNNSYNMGYRTGAPFGNYSDFGQLNRRYASTLGNVKFKKVSLYDHYAAIAVDSEGNAWVWGQQYQFSNMGLVGPTYSIGGTTCYGPIKLNFPDNAKIVDAIIANCSGAAIDEDGKLYIWNNGTPQLVTNSDNLLAGKKIVKIAFGADGIYAMDDNGEVFLISSSGTVVKSITNDFEIVAKDMYSSSKNDAIVIKDTDDELWGLGSLSEFGLSGTATEPVKLTGLTSNKLYGKTVEKLNNDFIVKDGDNSRIYKKSRNTYTVSGLIKYIDESTGNYINSNGDIVYSNYTIIADSNVKFTKLNRSYAISNDKNLYKIEQVVENAQYVYKAIKVEGVSNVVDVIDGGNMSFCLDENHNLYALGTGYIGNAEQGSTTPVKVLENAESLPTIIGNSSKESIFCKDTNNKLWTWGLGYDGTIATGSVTPTTVLENVDKFKCVSAGNNANGYSLFIKDISGNMWVSGMNANASYGIRGILGTGDFNNYAAPTNISEGSSGLGKIKDFGINYNGAIQVWAINDNNDIYFWGGSYRFTIPQFVESSSENLTFVTTSGNYSKYTTFSTVLKTTGGKYYSVNQNGTTGVVTPMFNGMSNIKEYNSSYILTNDGKVYDINNLDTALNDKESFENALKKQFYLIKDAKYNN